VRPEWRLSPEQAEHFLRARRSIRVFRDRPVDAGRIERLIRVARYAPSGHNRQPVRWLVISGGQVRAIGRMSTDARLLATEPNAHRPRMGLDRVVAAWDAGTIRSPERAAPAGRPRREVRSDGAERRTLARLTRALRRPRSARRL
jgi:hypothetical protein